MKKMHEAASGSAAPGPTAKRATPPRVFAKSFFARDADIVAKDLLGGFLFVSGVGGKIVETESYDARDPASHSFRGHTRSNAAMFGPAGHAYIYRSYGLHWCLNVVCNRASALLIRALEPTRGIEHMITRRNTEDRIQLCKGPGRLCAALGIAGQLNHASLFVPPFRLKPAVDAPDIATGGRIGITKAADAPRRYGVRHSPYLSKPIR